MPPLCVRIVIDEELKSTSQSANKSASAIASASARVSANTSMIASEVVSEHAIANASTNESASVNTSQQDIRQMSYAICQANIMKQEPRGSSHSREVNLD